jgi:prepilin-type N-terminal cleavage/methylation domain-containing protein
MIKQHRKGFTIVELLVVVSIIALLIAILLPAIGKARDAARVTQSSANLRNLAVANESYSSDWADRQFTAVPDDMGLSPNADPLFYNNNISCMAQQIAGIDATGKLWGAWCSGDLCPDSYDGDSGLWNGFFVMVYQPLSYGAPIPFGSFRTPNVKAFNAYVGSRFYDPVFYAPKDTYALNLAEGFFSSPEEFVATESTSYIAWSSYCWSASAMWNPEVHSRCGHVNPKNAPAAFRSPSVGQCRFPDLKTRMLEHNWMQNNETDKNPAFENFDDPSWTFNQGYNSKPVTMFYDGHVGVVGVADAMEADTRAQKQAENNNTCNYCATSPGSTNECQPGLWSRDTQWGTDGYYGNFSYDTIVDTAYHVLTTDGILGRDVIGAK